MSVLRMGQKYQLLNSEHKAAPKAGVFFCRKESNRSQMNLPLLSIVRFATYSQIARIEPVCLVRVLRWLKLFPPEFSSKGFHILSEP